MQKRLQTKLQGFTERSMANCLDVHAEKRLLEKTRGNVKELVYGEEIKVSR